MNSMTGYGSAEERHELLTVHARISSVNRKHLDVRLGLPRELSFLEPDIRGRLADTLSRGTLNVQFDLTLHAGQAGAPAADLALARAYHRELVRIAEDLGLVVDISLRDVMLCPDLIPVRSHVFTEDELRRPAMAAFEGALRAFLAMRATEGRTLCNDLKQRGDMLVAAVARIRELAPRQPEHLRERLYQRVRDLIEGIQVDDERLSREIVFFAERCDITEELVRLSSHLEQLAIQLDAAEPIGRKLDFLMQEIGREINTIGSKSNDRDIAQLVIDMKTEVDRMREQGMNIE